MTLLTLISIIEMEEVRVAKRKSSMNSRENHEPPVISANTFGSMMNRSPGPCASSCMPNDATAGETASPAKNGRAPCRGREKRSSGVQAERIQWDERDGT